MRSLRDSGEASLENLRSLGTRWRAFWRTPDPLLQDEGGVGELTVARIRLVVTGIIAAVTGAVFLADRSSSMMQGGLLAASGAFALSLAVYALVKHSAVGTWIGFATGAMDATGSWCAAATCHPARGVAATVPATVTQRARSRPTSVDR